MDAKLKELQRCGPQDAERAESLVNELKVAYLKQQMDESTYRSVLEAAVVAFRESDDADRHLQALLGLPSAKESSNYGLCLSIYLMKLLIQNQLGDFHALLQANLDLVAAKDPNVSYCVSLEQDLMVGNYSNIKSPPHNYLEYFVKALRPTICELIANTLETAYPQIEISHAAELMGLSTTELQSYLAEFRPDWIVEGTRIILDPAKVAPESHYEMRESAIAELLSYGVEQNRII